MKRDDVMREFVCTECGRGIRSFGYDTGSDVCGACQTMPGWWKIPELRAKLDPEMPPLNDNEEGEDDLR
jgi:hypothetical protein